MPSPLVTVLVPNFRTPQLTKLCLRSLRKYTDQSKIRVLVIDNASGDGDESLAYLRSLKWITLVENEVSPGTPVQDIHSQSLDKLLAMTDTPFVLSIHTDTVVLRPDWLEYLLSKFTTANVAGVGSWKLSTYPPLKRMAKAVEDWIRVHVIRSERARRAVLGVGDNYKYLRSHCALYRTELLKNETRGFFDGMTAGKSLHKILCDNGHEMIFLPENELSQYIAHFDHGTMILNPQLGGRRTTKPKARKKLGRSIDRQEFIDILNDDSLD